VSAEKVLTPQERERRVSHALAEAGYPDAETMVLADGGIMFLPPYLPLEVLWRAGVVSQVEAWFPCWPCYRDADGQFERTRGRCTHDPLTSEWPEVIR
jgi:hypothetical protein